MLWMAGVLSPASMSRPLPPWVKTRELREPLRSPPTVTEVVAQSDLIDDSYIPRYMTPPAPQPTQGPPVRRIEHEGHPDHTSGDPEDCARCGERIADIITDLRVGYTGRNGAVLSS